MGVGNIKFRTGVQVQRVPDVRGHQPQSGSLVLSSAQALKSVRVRLGDTVHEVCKALYASNFSTH